MSGDSMHQPRDPNGRFSSPVSLAQFEEFRRAMDQRFKAQEQAVADARRAVEELTKTHAAAHEREHQTSERALDLARSDIDKRVSRVEKDIDTRFRPLEDANLISATKSEVKAVAEAADQGVKNARSVGTKAGWGALAAGAIAIFELIRGMASGSS